jgi:hypothetical protein
MMDWSLVGWIFLGVSALILGVLTFLLRNKGQYAVRDDPAIQQLINARTVSIEAGVHQHVGLGQNFWSRTYPGLGLYALDILPQLTSLEMLSSPGTAVSAGDPSLLIIARQILHNQYRNGFSLDLSIASPELPGPTPLSYTAGLLAEMGNYRHGSLALSGNYGVEALLFSEAQSVRQGYFFSASGNLTSQAVLFSSVRDLMIGESIYMLKGLLQPSASAQAGWLTEDLLRVLLIGFILIAVVLKMAGVL